MKILTLRLPKIKMKNKLRKKIKKKLKKFKIKKQKMMNKNILDISLDLNL